MNAITIDGKIREASGLICQHYKQCCSKCPLHEKIYWDNRFFEEFEQKKKLKLVSEENHYEGTSLCESCTDQAIKTSRRCHKNWLLERLTYFIKRNGLK